jgi:hypothetical protein
MKFSKAKPVEENRDALPSPLRRGQGEGMIVFFAPAEYSLKGKV